MAAAGSRGFTQRLPVFLLLAIHVPFLIAYLSTLWRQTHYQFFPFAIGAFVWLFATRRDRQPERWTWPTWILLAVDVACLAAQFYSYSPWLAVVGLTCTLTAWCYANQDAGYYRRLTYLSLLPMITLRLPLNYDERVIHWLQRHTTSLASDILHRLGMLHFRQGNVLQFPGKSFMVEEACSGVQSLFTILFLAALLICLKRRSVVHGAVLLAASIVMAGIMNTLRVVTIAVAWDQYSYDLSTGIAHDIVGHCCLAVAALMLMSADAFLGFIASPVPDIQKPGPVGMYFNPLTYVWNHLVAVIPMKPEASVTATEPGTGTAVSLERRISDDENDRSFPTGLDNIRPSNVLHFLFGWCECWLFSRNYRELLAGLPFLASTALGVLVIWWMQYSSQDDVIANLETAFDSAVAEGDKDRQEIFLRALCEVRPTEPQYRFRLGQHLLQIGRLSDGLGEILPLTPEIGSGMLEARMWLVQQAMSPNPLKPLTNEEMETQLKLVLDLSSNHLDAHRALAALYANRKEWKLAEQHLSVAATVRPELYIDLAGLKRNLHRDPADVSAIAQKAISAMSVQLEKNRDDAETRLALVAAYILADQESAAREILMAGIEQTNAPALISALADLDLMLVQRRLAESPINRDACVPVVIDALRRDPGNVQGLTILTHLRTIGADLSAESLSGAITHWRRTVEKNPESTDHRLALGQLLSDAGELEESIRIIEPLLADRPELRLPFAQMLKKVGRLNEATLLLETLVREAQDTLEQTPDDVPALAIRAEAMLALGRASEARELLAALAKDPQLSHIPEDANLATWYGLACIEYYDQLTGYDGDSSKKFEPASGTPVSLENQEPEFLLQLLADAFDCRQTCIHAIDRLATLSFSSHEAAEAADEMLRQLRLDGQQGAEVLNLIGTHAIVLQHYGKAVNWLEQANAMTRSRNPMILNNLATAIVRSGSRPNAKALELANQTLALIPDHPDALSTRGEIYVALEAWTDAVADLTEALKLRHDSVLIHELLEKAYRGLEEPKMQELHRRRAEELKSQKTSS